MKRFFLTLLILIFVPLTPLLALVQDADPVTLEVTKLLAASQRPSRNIMPICADPATP